MDFVVIEEKADAASFTTFPELPRANEPRVPVCVLSRGGPLRDMLLSCLVTENPGEKQPRQRRKGANDGGGVARSGAFPPLSARFTSEYLSVPVFPPVLMAPTPAQKNVLGAKRGKGRGRGRGRGDGRGQDSHNAGAISSIGSPAGSNAGPSLPAPLVALLPRNDPIAQEAATAAAVARSSDLLSCAVALSTCRVAVVATENPSGADGSLARLLASALAVLRLAGESVSCERVIFVHNTAHAPVGHRNPVGPPFPSMHRDADSSISSHPTTAQPSQSTPADRRDAEGEPAAGVIDGSSSPPLCYFSRSEQGTAGFAADGSCEALLETLLGSGIRASFVAVMARPGTPRTAETRLAAELLATCERCRVPGARKGATLPPTAKEWVRITRGVWDRLHRSTIIAEFALLAAGTEGLDHGRRM